MIARRLLSAPFRLVDTLGHPGETLEYLGQREAKFGYHAVVDPDLAGPRSWETKSFIYEANTRLLLDTGLGWALKDFSVITRANRSMVEQTANPPKPNILKWLKAQTGSERRGEVVWLPYGSGNYFHFLNDMVGGLALLRKRIGRRRVLVERSLMAKPFFNEIIGYSSFLSSLNWKPYDSRRWVKCHGLLTAGVHFSARETFDGALSLLDRLPPIRSRPARRIFISRAKGSARTPDNIEKIEAFFASRGFDVILFERMSVQDQREAINSAALIVALHGAGLTNIIWHQAPGEVALVEIMPPDYRNPCFGFLAGELGMQYQCIVSGTHDLSTRIAEALNRAEERTIIACHQSSSGPPRRTSSATAS